MVAAWLFSSSETSPRQASDEMISVGLKCLRAKVRLARARGADQHDQGELREIVDDVSSRRTPPSESATRRRRPPARWARTAPRSRTAPRQRSAQASNSAGSTRSGGPGAELPGRQSRIARCTPRSAWSATTVVGWANSKTTRSNAASRGGSRCSIDLHDGGRVEAREPLVAIDERAMDQRERAALPLGQAVEVRAALAAVSRARSETSMPTISSNCRSSLSSAREQLALAAAEVEHTRWRRLRLSAARTAASRCSLRLSGLLDGFFLVRRGLGSSPSGSAASAVLPSRRSRASRAEARLVLQVAARRSALAPGGAASQPSPWRSSFSTSSSPTQ